MAKGKAKSEPKEISSEAEILAKERAIKKESNRLKKVFNGIDEKKKKVVNSTIEDCAFLTVEMASLRRIILRDGSTCTYQNGENQFGTKQSPEAQLYLQMSQKLNAGIKVLVSCLPKEIQQKIEDDGFDCFVNEREDV